MQGTKGFYTTVTCALVVLWWYFISLCPGPAYEAWLGLVQTALAQVDTPSATLQPMEALTGSRAWVLDADGTALQRVNYSVGHWSALADALATLEAADDSADGRASLLRASHLVPSPSKHTSTCRNM